MKIPKVKIKKIKESFKNLPRIIGVHAFLSFLILVFLALILGGVIFYTYSILAQKKELEPSEEVLKFEEAVYQEVLKIWQEQEKKFKETDFRKYPELFLETREGVVKPEQPPEEKPGEPLSQPPGVKELKNAVTLEEFYSLQGKIFPSVKERAIVWEEMGLGLAEVYVGSTYQNVIFLEALKRELTE